MVELAAAALLDRHGEEEPVAVPGEDRFLVLQRGRRKRRSDASVKHPCLIPISEREGGAGREGTNLVFIWAGSEGWGGGGGGGGWRDDCEV